MDQVIFCFMGHTYAVLNANSYGEWKLTELLNGTADAVATAQLKTGHPTHTEA